MVRRRGRGGRPGATTEPRVTIGMPVWNEEANIRSGLGALLGQTFGDFELIISDNGSTDGTQAICEEYATLDSRVRYARNETNIGLQGNFERVLEQATAPYFMWGCPDDQWEPTYVAKMVAALDQNETAVLAGSNAAAIDRQGATLQEFDNVAVYAGGRLRDRAARFVAEAPGGGHATLIYALMRTPVIKRVGYAPRGSIRDTNRGYYAADLLTLFRLMFEGDFHVVDETLYYHRDTEFGVGEQGLRRFVAVARAFGSAHGYYDDLRSILRTGGLDDRTTSALIRMTYRGELAHYPAYARRLIGRRAGIVARRLRP